MSDWTDDIPGWDDFVRHTREETVKKMDASAFVMTFSPGDEVDVKIAVETGLAVLLNKPIITLATAGRDVPPGLRRISHKVIEVDDIDTEAGQAELYRQLKPFLDEFGA